MSKFKTLAIAALISLVALAPVHGSSPDRVGAFDFSYQSSGDSRVRPAQVFDNGKSTYFQFRAGEEVPAIMDVSKGGAVLLVPEFEGPYVRVPGVGSAFVLKLGLGVGKVTYVGDGRAAAPAADPTAAVNSQREQAAAQRLMAASTRIQGGADQNMIEAPPRPIDLTVDSYATPLRGDRVQWTTTPAASPELEVPFVKGNSALGPAATKIVRAFGVASKEAQKIIVKGIDDSSYKEGLAEQRAKAITDILVGAGIPKERVSVELSAIPRSGAVAQGVVGATLVSYSSKPIDTHLVKAGQAPLPVADKSVEAVVRQLKEGQITPAQAAAALDMARQNTGGSDLSKEAPAVLTAEWAIKLSDQTFANMIKRWGDGSGWRVVVKGAPEIRITGDDVIRRPDFLQAADFAVSQAKKAGFPVKAVAYSNNVLLLTKDTP